MHVLYIGSRAAEADSLNIEREITELQSRFSEAVGESVRLSFVPTLLAENLAKTISKYRPDVLHISAHGERGQLALANEAGKEVDLSAETLLSSMRHDQVPKVVYLNACDSESIAQALTVRIPMAIGINAPITNRAARQGAANFYSSLLEGASVKHAFEAASSTIRMMQSAEVSASLFCKETIRAVDEYLHRVPRLIADFEHGVPRLSSGGYDLRVGVAGCPANTVQLLVFTDDPSFVADSSGFTGYVVRRQPTRNVLWTDDKQTWWSKGDFRIFATGVAGDGQAFTVSATSICAAVEHRYELTPSRQMPPSIAEALVRLRKNDGAELDFPVPQRPVDRPTASRAPAA